MTDDADLPSQGDVFSEASATRNAGLRDDEAMRADDDIVSDLHEIIDLGAPFDPRFAH